MAAVVFWWWCNAQFVCCFVCLSLCLSVCLSVRAFNSDTPLIVNWAKVDNICKIFPLHAQPSTIDFSCQINEGFVPHFLCTTFLFVIFNSKFLVVVFDFMKSVTKWLPLRVVRKMLSYLSVSAIIISFHCYFPPGAMRATNCCGEKECGTLIYTKVAFHKEIHALFFVCNFALFIRYFLFLWWIFANLLKRKICNCLIANCGMQQMNKTCNAAINIYIWILVD